MRTLVQIAGDPKLVTSYARALECIRELPRVQVDGPLDRIIRAELVAGAQVYAQLAVAEAIDEAAKCHECGASVNGHLHYATDVLHRIVEKLA